MCLGARPTVLYPTYPRQPGCLTRIFLTTNARRSLLPLPDKRAATSCFSSTSPKRKQNPQIQTPAQSHLQVLRERKYSDSKPNYKPNKKKNRITKGGKESKTKCYLQDRKLGERGRSRNERSHVNQWQPRSAFAISPPRASCYRVTTHTEEPKHTSYKGIYGLSRCRWFVMKMPI